MLLFTITRFAVTHIYYHNVVKEFKAHVKAGFEQLVCLGIGVHLGQ